MMLHSCGGMHVQGGRIMSLFFSGMGSVALPMVFPKLFNAFCRNSYFVSRFR